MVMLTTSLQQVKFTSGGAVLQNLPKLFNEHLKRLKFEAFRRPKRRVFVDINELEEGMNSLWQDHLVP